MIVSFRSKGLNELWAKSSTAKIDAKLHKRILARLDALDAAQRVDDMNIPGFDFHTLRGYAPTRYTVYVNGPWCITFEFQGQDATNVDLEQYH